MSVSGEKREWRKGECEWREKGMEERSVSGEKREWRKGECEGREGRVMEGVVIQDYISSGVKMTDLMA